MWGGSWDVRWLAEVESTNSYLREQARRGSPEGLVAVADYQSAGRGRLDRRWESPPGSNLLASVLLRPSCSGTDVHLCTGALALAAADACTAVATVQPELKWPNDLLVSGSKLAGILAEAEFTAGELTAVVVGIGLNVAWPGPADAGGTCLDDLGGGGHHVDRMLLLHALLDALTPRRRQLDQADGRECLAGEIRRRCSTLGREVRVTLVDDEFSGLATTIDEQGRLVVDTATGARAVSAGDVVHLRRPPGSG